MTTIHVPTLGTNLPVCFTPIVESPFFFHPHLQIPQSDFGTVPATCLVKDSSQMTLDYLLGCPDLLRDLCIRASLENKCCDSPLFTCKVRVSKQQRHTAPHFKKQSCHLQDRFAIVWKRVTTGVGGGGSQQASSIRIWRPIGSGWRNRATTLRLTGNNRTRSGRTEKNDSVYKRYPEIAFLRALAGDPLTESGNHSERASVRGTSQPSRRLRDSAKQSGPIHGYTNCSND